MAFNLSLDGSDKGFYRLLSCLQQPISQKDLARETNMTVGNCCYLLKELVEKGFVQKYVSKIECRCCNGAGFHLNTPRGKVSCRQCRGKMQYIGKYAIYLLNPLYKTPLLKIAAFANQFFSPSTKRR